MGECFSTFYVEIGNKYERSMIAESAHNSFAETLSSSCYNGDAVVNNGFTARSMGCVRGPFNGIVIIGPNEKETDFFNVNRARRWRELAGELVECAGEIGLVEVFYLMHDGTGCAIKGVPA